MHPHVDLIAQPDTSGVNDMSKNCLGEGFASDLDQPIRSTHQHVTKLREPGSANAMIGVPELHYGPNQVGW